MSAELIDTIIVYEGPRRGVYVCRDHPLSKGASQRLAEMVAGAERLRGYDENTANSGIPPWSNFRVVSNKEFGALCGLVVVGHAMRMTL